MSPLIESVPIQDLDSLLAQTLGNNVQVQHVEWRPLTDPGENFGSVILAVNVTISRDNKTEALNLVAKLPPKSAYLLDLFNSPVTFKKELHFYSEVAKAFINLQLHNGVPEEDVCVIAPKYYGGRLGLRNSDEFDEQAAIILENLKFNGFFTEDRIWGLDRRHIEFATKKLAILHAMTIALKLKESHFFETVVLDVLKQAVNETAERCVIDMIRKAQEDLKSMPEAEPYLDSINKTIEYSIQKNKDPTKPEEPWATLVHNDFWVNNMMFQHNDSGDLVDLKMVDFQLSIYDYGIYDLLFFLISSAKREVIDNDLDEMIDLYYDSFIRYLKMFKIDTDVFSKNKFTEILSYCAPIKFNQCIMMVQVIQASRDSAPTPQDLEGDDIFFSRAGDTVCKQKLLHIVSTFDKRGWLIK